MNASDAPHCANILSTYKWLSQISSKQWIRKCGLTPHLLVCIIFILSTSIATIIEHQTEAIAQSTNIALYPRDGRQLLTSSDHEQFPGAGVLMCDTELGIPERAAAAWLIGAHDLVLLNAHNFIDKYLSPTRPVTDCYFRIGGRDFYFDPDTLRTGLSNKSNELHITDDWALLKLLQPTPEDIRPQPVPNPAMIGKSNNLDVIMISPAGHSNTQIFETLEHCKIHRIDEPSEGGMRRVRHDCNDGYGGSGSGIFTADGNLLALHSASLDMNIKRDFDIETHYGSALIIEGDLASSIRDILSDTK